MSGTRLTAAAQALGFSTDSSSLEEALDVKVHLPLALVGDKVLDLLICLAYYHHELKNKSLLSNGQISDQVVRLAKNNDLIDIGVRLQLANKLLFDGRDAPDHIPTAYVQRGSAIAGSNATLGLGKPDCEITEPHEGKGRKHKGSWSSARGGYEPKTLANTVEAIIGAAFLDGGLKLAGDVVVDMELDKSLDDLDDPEKGWKVKWKAIEHLYADVTSDSLLHNADREQDDDMENVDEQLAAYCTLPYCQCLCHADR